jgi:hypothetical protein
MSVVHSAACGDSRCNRSGQEPVVRAWLRSERWDEAMRLRPPPRRTYRWREADAQAEAAIP